MYIFSTVFISCIVAATLDCDFDKDFCEWRQDDNDGFDWNREDYNTRSISTGPTSDHTTGCKVYTNHVECFNDWCSLHNLIKSINKIICLRNIWNFPFIKILLEMQILVYEFSPFNRRTLYLH